MQKIKNFLRSFILTARAYSAISAKRTERALRQRLQKSGVETIRKIQQLLEEAEVYFYFDFGTLLGIIREGRLLSHDMDVDVAIFPKNAEDINRITELLIAGGCAHRYRFYIDESGVVEDSFVYNGLKFDINYFYCKDGKDIGYVMYFNPEKKYKEGERSVVKLTSPHTGKIEKTEFNGMMINIPSEPEKYLAVRYGDSWRIPDKSFIYWKGPSTSPTDYIGKIIVYE